MEEEGWLEDGTPLIVDGAAPSATGDDPLISELGGLTVAELTGRIAALRS